MVEMMIVIAIIAILSVLAVGGYTSYRKAVLVELAGDDLVAQLYELREKTIHGNFGKDRFEAISSVLFEDQTLDDPEAGKVPAKCFGLYFTDGKIYRFSQDFDSEVEWAGQEVDGDWKEVGCGEVSAVNVMQEQLLLDVTVQGITEILGDDSESELNNFYLRFVPPTGAVEAGIADVPNQNVSDQIKVILQYGLEEEERFVKEVLIDLNYGSAKVNQNEENV